MVPVNPHQAIPHQVQNAIAALLTNAEGKKHRCTHGTLVLVHLHTWCMPQIHVHEPVAHTDICHVETRNPMNSSYCMLPLRDLAAK